MSSVYASLLGAEFVEFLSLVTDHNFKFNHHCRDLSTKLCSVTFHNHLKFFKRRIKFFNPKQKRFVSIKITNTLQTPTYFKNFRLSDEGNGVNERRIKLESDDPPRVLESPNY